MSAVFAAGVVSFGFGAYCGLYWLVVARTERGKDPKRDITALFNQRHERLMLWLFVWLTTLGVVLAAVGRFG